MLGAGCAEVYVTLAGILCFGHHPQAVFPRAAMF
jgi:predicted HTH transcriptional regulator